MGTITTVSSTVLTVDGFTFAPEPGLTVERSGDSLWNGLAIGVAIGTALGVATRVRGCFQGVTVECVVKPGLAFGALGALIDHRRVGRTTVFVGTGPSSARLIPLLSSDAKGLLVRFHF
jgi:hypothetical protein